MSSLSQDIVMPPCSVLITDISASTAKNSFASEQTIIPTAKRTRSVSPRNSTTANMHDETNDDALRVAVLKMQQDIQCLTKCQNVMTEKNEKLQEELTSVKSRLGYFDTDFQCEKQDLLQKLSAANQLNCDLTDTNGKLREDLKVAKNHSANVECNLQDFVQKLSAADKVNFKLTETNWKLQEDLNAASNHFTNMESNLQCQIQDLVHKFSAADRMNIELTDTNGKLQQELNAMRIHVANTESNLQYKIQEVVHKLSAADEVNLKLTETNGKIQEYLNAANNHFTDMESNLQCQIQDLVHKLSAADRMNIELTDTNGKLQQKLDAAKIELKENEKLSDLKARTKNLINEFQTRIEETEKVNAQLAGKNEKLQTELNILKQNGGKDKELFQLNSLLPNRPEIHIQTEHKEVSDIYNGYDQAELEEENIQYIGLVGDNCEERLLEQVKFGECVTVEPNGGALNGNQDFFWEEEFVSDDPIVQKCRPVLMQQKFGWMKFQPFKSTKFRPAFVYAADDKDGLEQAQEITKDGCIALGRSTFWDFHFACELPDDKKRSTEVLWLKKFNQRFGSNFN